MPVVILEDCPAGRIIGITQAHCIFRLTAPDMITVAPWSEVALGNVCPSHALLPSDVQVNDRLNASATVLRELLKLRQASRLTDLQSNACQELLAELCECQDD